MKAAKSPAIFRCTKCKLAINLKTAKALEARWRPEADAAAVRRIVGGQDRSIDAQMAATPRPPVILADRAALFGVPDFCQ
jgi:hypothetical protein